MTNPQTIIAVRHRTHGDFETQAEFSQYLKKIMRERIDQDRAPLWMREALEMICLKLSRVAFGDCTHIDHWRDISGYAQLVVKGLEKAQEANAPERLPNTVEGPWQFPAPAMAAE